MKGEHFTLLYTDLIRGGDMIEIRGEKCLELIDYTMIIDDPLDCLTSYKARNLNLDYCKKEWLWYLHGDRYDASIMEHASMWKKIQLADGAFNSNYGQYIFREAQFDWVVSSLIKDPHSRQACMQLLNSSHMWHGNPDVVCTMGIQFLIRKNRLSMYVRMRSNDAIFGMTNDVFCFSQLHQMVYWALKEKGLDIELGEYCHNVGSLHVYERHFSMLTQLVAARGDDRYDVEMPRPKSFDDFKSLIGHGPGNGSAYANWMLS